MRNKEMQLGSLLAASVEGLLAGAVSAGTVAVLLTAAAVSGANVDLLYFNEG